MRIRSLVTVFVCFLSAMTSLAQTAPTAQSIEAQLRGPFLMLRGMYGGHKVKFDAEGNLVGKAHFVPFGLSVLRVDRVRVTDSDVEIDATREGLVFSAGGIALPPGKFSAEPWGGLNGVKIEITRDPIHPALLNSALAKVLSIGFDPGLIAQAPEYWQPWLRRLMNLPPKQELQMPEISLTGSNGSGQKVKPPRVLRSEIPEYPPTAALRSYRGTALLGFTVNASGVPENIHIVRPLGMGLDEEAVNALRRFRFAPATRDGRPVSVQVNLEMRFPI